MIIADKIKRYLHRHRSATRADLVAFIDAEPNAVISTMTRMINAGALLVTDRRIRTAAGLVKVYVLAPEHSDADQALVDAEDSAKSKTTTRSCLCCGKPFPSHGIHNRLCVKCATGDMVGGIEAVQ
jgi:hypothetical protein